MGRMRDSDDGDAENSADHGHVICRLTRFADHRRALDDLAVLGDIQCPNNEDAARPRPVLINECRALDGWAWAECLLDYQGPLKHRVRHPLKIARLLLPDPPRRPPSQPQPSHVFVSSISSYRGSLGHQDTLGRLSRLQDPPRATSMPVRPSLSSMLGSRAAHCMGLLGRPCVPTSETGRTTGRSRFSPMPPLAVRRWLDRAFRPATRKPDR